MIGPKKKYKKKNPAGYLVDINTGEPITPVKPGDYEENLGKYNEIHNKTGDLSPQFLENIYDKGKTDAINRFKYGTKDKNVGEIVPGLSSFSTPVTSPAKKYGPPSYPTNTENTGLPKLFEYGGNTADPANVKPAERKVEPSGWKKFAHGLSGALSGVAGAIPIVGDALSPLTDMAEEKAQEVGAGKAFNISNTVGNVAGQAGMAAATGGASIGMGGMFGKKELPIPEAKYGLSLDKMEYGKDIINPDLHPEGYETDKALPHSQGGTIVEKNNQEVAEVENNEVIVDDTVYSGKLINPNTGNEFDKDMKKSSKEI
jgi:hypothetical protein